MTWAAIHLRHRHELERPMNHTALLIDNPDYLDHVRDERAQIAAWCTDQTAGFWSMDLVPGEVRFAVYEDACAFDRWFTTA